MIEYKTLEKARENMENALQRVKEVEKKHGCKSRQWWDAWNEYKRFSSDYRSFLICHYNL